MSLTLAFLLVGLTSSLPSVLSSGPETEPDTKQPENTMMGKRLKDLGVEICPDKLHLCPGTAECCKGHEGKWDCCPKTSNPVSGECCNHLGFIWMCCTPLAPSCHWWGCWWA